MEKLSSIVDAIKERLTNPLFLSFLISWFCWNWQIPVALFWFDTKQLYSTANWNYVDYVRSQLDNWSIIVPVLFALGYTFGMPLLMNRVRQFNAWIVKKGNDLVFKESQESKVSFENYYTVLHRNEEKARKLEEMIENQNNLRTSYDKSQKQNVELETVITARDNELKTLKDEKKVIAEENKVKIDQKDMTIDTMQIALDGLSMENSKLQNFNEDNRKHILRLEESLKESEQIILKKNNEINSLSQEHAQKLQQVDIKYSNDLSFLKQELAVIKDEIDSTVLNGRWHVAYMYPEGEVLEDINIDGENFIKNTAIHQILSFRKRDNQMSFVLLRNGVFEVFVLNIENFNMLLGEANNTNVVFNRNPLASNSKTVK